MWFLCFLATLFGVAGTSALAAGQPVTQTQADAGGWWGATAWILITVVFLAAAIVFVLMGMRRSNR